MTRSLGIVVAKAYILASTHALVAVFDLTVVSIIELGKKTIENDRPKIWIHIPKGVSYS